ncbi:anti-sigma factor [Sediminibacterium goheungense]|uniref:Anti-sigma-K factor RskA n=1 Tax=Sediminibacterium goheungense TaxID=1086393 RepID=A0A4R6IX26_9BACT|nr:anti-sigma factor [Sediminibacterium goheungense]TDO26445.1 anti-sigma-K factor RskA [Sediminibacterium goheungense]
MNIQAYIESGIIESYVLGMADDQERAELEQLSRKHPEIRAAIEAFELSLEQTALQNAMPPAPSIKKDLFVQLESEFNPATEAKLVSMPTAQTGWLRYVAAASVILLVVSAATNVYFYKQFREASNQYQALLVEKTSLLAQNEALQTKGLDLYNGMLIMSDPAFTKISMPGIKTEENKLATVFWDKKKNEVYLLANRLPQTSKDTQYQLWAIVEGKPVDAGMIDTCSGLCKMKNISNASAFAITLEKRGGSPTPNLNQLQVIGNVNG